MDTFPAKEDVLCCGAAALIYSASVSKVVVLTARPTQEPAEACTRPPTRTLFMSMEFSHGCSKCLVSVGSEEKLCVCVSQPTLNSCPEKGPRVIMCPCASQGGSRDVLPSILHLNVAHLEFT